MKMDKKKKVFIKIEKNKQILDSLKLIRGKQELIKSLFKEYDALNIKESKIFDTWGADIEDFDSKLYQLTL